MKIWNVRSVTKHKSKFLAHGRFCFLNVAKYKNSKKYGEKIIPFRRVKMTVIKTTEKLWGVRKK